MTPRPAQDPVDRLVAAGASFVSARLHAPPAGHAHIVRPLERHDDHIHVRFPAP